VSEPAVWPTAARVFGTVLVLGGLAAVIGAYLGARSAVSLRDELAFVATGGIGGITALGLGAAGNCTVFELGTGRVVLSGPSGSIQGDVCVAQGKVSISQKQSISGKIELGDGASLINHSGSILGGIQRNVDLTAQINAAFAAASTDAALTCTQTYPLLDGNTLSVITGVSGLNVICVSDISLSTNHVLITGPADARFVFNVSGNFVLAAESAAPQVRVDTSTGLLPSAVLFNVLGAGSDVVIAGSPGGANCCGAVVDGTILAPQRNVFVSPALVNGEVISAKDINIVGGSKIACPTCSSNKISVETKIVAPTSSQ